MPDAHQTTGLVVADNCCTDRAAELISRYHLPLLDSEPHSGFFLRFDNNRLALVQSGPQAPGPILVDFINGALDHRRRFGGGRGQPLPRATGMQRGRNPVIWDATAGLGRDAFILASLGGEVTLCERSPILAALLDQALFLASADPVIGTWVDQRMQLVHGDSGELLPTLHKAQRPQVVYLDPMYPPGKSAVLVKKEMRALQQLLGHDSNPVQLLETALETATRRVVVKRPKRAGWLHERQPSTCIESRKTRYDIYITGSQTVAS